jgi:hypothetical protein
MLKSKAAVADGKGSFGSIAGIKHVHIQEFIEQLI